MVNRSHSWVQLSFHSLVNLPLLPLVELSSLPSLVELYALTSLAELFALSSLSELSALPSLGELSALSSLSELSALPSFLGLFALSSFIGLSALPSVQLSASPLRLSFPFLLLCGAIRSPSLIELSALGAFRSQS